MDKTVIENQELLLSVQPSTVGDEIICQTKSGLLTPKDSNLGYKVPSVSQDSMAQFSPVMSSFHYRYYWADTLELYTLCTYLCLLNKQCLCKAIYKMEQEYFFKYNNFFWKKISNQKHDFLINHYKWNILMHKISQLLYCYLFPNGKMEVCKTFPFLTQKLFATDNCWVIE